MAARLCGRERGCRHLEPCPVHSGAQRRTQSQEAARDAKRGTTTQRGYGAAHRRAAERLKRAMRDGQPCARCGQPMYRRQLDLPRSHPDGLDAGHHPERPASAGHLPERMEHRRCNRGKRIHH